MKNNLKILEVIKLLKIKYPIAKCSLIYKTPLELIICARLSAQCTDNKVNSVTPSLFSKFKCAKDFAKADPKEIEDFIKPCGLYKVKAQNIVDMCKKIISNFNGNVPDNLEDLTSLPGIGRKTANLTLAQVYKKPAIIVDTHFMRITKRLGFHNLKDPFKIELLMKNLVPSEESIDFCHRLVMHGREICSAKKPLCERCPLNKLCDFYVKNKFS